MRSNYKPLGKYIRLVDERNAELHDLPLMGLSVSKVFFPTIANLVGTDMSTYKIVYKNQFTYIADTSRRGDKIAIALNGKFDKMLVSQAYTPFEVSNTNELDPEYLMMWFRRPEFDRYARFKSHGSAREIFDWEDMCNTLLPVPSITMQREIVKEYNVVQNRVALNQQLIQKLEETAQAVYKRWFVEGIDIENFPEGWKIGLISDLCEYSNKRIPIKEIELDKYISTENMLQNRGGVGFASNLPPTGNVISFIVGNILISNIRPYFKKIWLANFNGGCSTDVLCLVPKEGVPSLYLYQILEKDSFFEYVMAGSKGTKMPRGDKKWIMDYPTIIPSKDLLDKFNKTVGIIQNKIQLTILENQKLSELKDLLLSKLATV